MHFWIDKRASQLQYGRRRPGVFYGGRLTGLGRHIDKNAAPSYHGSSSSSSTNPPAQQSSSGTSNSSSMVTPVHRFQQCSTADSTREAQLACLNLAANGTAGGASPSNRSRAYSNGSNRLSSGHSSTTSRSRSRSHSRERRSSSLRRTPSHVSSDPGSTTVPDYGPHLTSASLTPTDIRDPASCCKSDHLRAKRIGLTLCFMAFILLCTVAAKFIIEGPSLIDSSRRHPAATDTSFFLITELVFVAFAMVLFFSGVHCLRSRTNLFLMRAFQNQINQNIAQSTVNTRDGIDGFGLNHNNSGSDYFEHSSQEDDENQDNYFLQQQSGSSGHHHIPGACFYHSPTQFNRHHHHHHNHRNSNSTHIISMVPDIVIGGYGGLPGRHGHHDRRHLSRENLQPPPYHIALYLPLPSQDYDIEDGVKDECDMKKCSALAPDGDNGKDSQQQALASSTAAEGDSHNLNRPTGNNLSSSTTNTNTTSNEQRAETPPPTYENAFNSVKKI